MVNGSNPNSLPLYEKTALKRTTHRVFDILIFFLLLSLLAYRLFLLCNHGFSWLQAIAFLCESSFSFVWFLLILIKWSPVDYATYPDRLLKREVELPAVDIFVTTADPALEPPLMTVNTVLSLLALDYPPEKMACYVSDDGCSPITLYSLTEAVEFAKMWVPFCRKYNVQVRAPFRYFLTDTPPPTCLISSGEFRNEWERMKDEYERLTHKIEEAQHGGISGRDVAEQELAVFSNGDAHSKNHPTIIKILWENKERISHGLPHLIYIAREKRLKNLHHYKAGAMNVLTRVSGLLTNAPYMLNMDCDMFSNNPQVILHAMCVLVDPNVDEQVGFVQFPQCFYDGLKDDPYGNQLVVLYEYVNRGIVGLQGPFYGGTGCFHRRKVIYGHLPQHHHHPQKITSEKQLLLKSFGYSNTFADSAARALHGNAAHYPQALSHCLDEAKHVAGCSYELGTTWGSQVGWIYGSTAEDVQTGLMIHRNGWRSIFISTNPPAFLGCAPSGGPDSLTQQKRWATGLLEVFFSKNCPIFAAVFGHLQLRQCAAYLWIFSWGLRSISELSYAALMAYCLLTNSHFFPNVREPAVCIPVSLFVVYNVQQLLQYFETGQSVRAWWNNQRMARVNAMCAWLFGFATVVLKLLGLAETVFDVTNKELSSEAESGRFTFDESPLFVPGTTVLFIQLAALLVGLKGLGGGGCGVMEMLCSLWVVLCLWPFLKGMFGRGKYGIPIPTIVKSAALSLSFVYLCLKQ